MKKKLYVRLRKQKRHKNLLQGVNFKGLQLVNNILPQNLSIFHQVATGLLKLGLLQLVICRFVSC